MGVTPLLSLFALVEKLALQTAGGCGKAVNCGRTGEENCFKGSPFSLFVPEMFVGAHADAEDGIQLAANSGRTRDGFT